MREKIQILTLASEDWTIQKSLEFFSVSEHTVKYVRKLKIEKWIWAIPSDYCREGLDKETKKCVVELYEKDVSCMCPDKKRLC